MAVDTKGHWVGIGVGDTDDPAMPRTAPNWHAIELLTDKLSRNFKWARDMGIVKSSVYTAIVATAVERYCTDKTINLPVVRDASGLAVANLAMRTRLGSFPPPKPPTHAAFTVRGTGGIIGQDYTSIIAQVLPGVYHEHPIPYFASMGGIPVAAAVNPSDPSGNECAEQARQMLTDAVLGSTVSFAVFGYSLGCKGPVLFLNDLFDPTNQLYAHRHRLVCAVMIADPWRPFGHTFYLGPIPAGQGIGTPYFTMSDAAIKELGWRCAWLSNPSDMYTNSPLGGTGAVLADVEQIILGTAVSDPMGTMMNAIKYLMKIIMQDGGLQTMFGNAGILGLMGGLAGGSMIPSVGLIGMLLPILEGGFGGLVSGIGGNGQNLPPGIAADVQAAILALKFFGSGIHGHVSYHDTPWGIGPQTYLDLGIQHALDWGRNTPVLT